jgi:hypothetical protein
MSPNEQITFEQAKELLAGCYRYQFGEPGHCEVDWEGTEVDALDLPIGWSDEEAPSFDWRGPKCRTRYHSSLIANGQWEGEPSDGLDIFLPSGRTEFRGAEALELCQLGRRPSSD